MWRGQTVCIQIPTESHDTFINKQINDTRSESSRERDRQTDDRQTECVCVWDRERETRERKSEREDIAS